MPDPPAPPFTHRPGNFPGFTSAFPVIRPLPESGGTHMSCAAGGVPPPPHRTLEGGYPPPGRKVAGGYAGYPPSHKWELCIIARVNGNDFTWTFRRSALSGCLPENDKGGQSGPGGGRGMPDTSPPWGWGGLCDLKYRRRGGIRHIPFADPGRIRECDFHQIPIRKKVPIPSSAVTPGSGRRKISRPAGNPPPLRVQGYP